MPKRRNVLVGLGGAVALAGCTGDESESSSEPEPATFEIIDVSSTADTVLEGESVILSATIENTGGLNGDTTVEFVISDIQREEELSIRRSDQAVIEYTIDTSSIGSGTYEYKFSIPGEESSDSINIRTMADHIKQVIDNILENQSNYDGIREIEVSTTDDEIAIEASSNWMGLRGTESEYNNKAADILEDVFESEVDIDYFEINLYAPTVDEYGEEGFSRALTVGMYEETANQINWDNYDSDNLSRHADTYNLNIFLF